VIAVLLAPRDAALGPAVVIGRMAAMSVERDEKERNRPRSTLAVQMLVRVSSFVVRSLPTNRSVLGKLKLSCVKSSARLRRYELDFDFYCRRPRLRWSASAFPDVLTRGMLFMGTYDEDVLVALENLIHPGDVVFDVGGHHGLMTVVAARAAGPDGLVVTFEPNPRARKQILRNAALNDVSNFVLEEIALSDTQGDAAFYVQTGDVSWNSTLIDGYLAAENHRAVDRITVKTQTLDSYIAATHRIPHVIKIDTEGSELRILQGAVETLSNERPLAIMEINPRAAQSAKADVSDLVGFWSDRSYRLLTPGVNFLGHYTFSHLEPFDEARHARSGKGYANVICVPEERAQALDVAPSTS
jgi:FkbM family methyltransferase